ncbi:MAG TPA: formyltransferase family protein, partial [Candidatus Baltobacteraceae bacterium]|nr:formyltransferase family protein [Candidatus Baltobacteraceae bacterium]
SNELVEGYWNALTTPYNPTSCVNTTNVNDPAVLAYLDEVKPDIIFAHCLNQFFGKKLRNKAKHGIFMWHVGITPEYKGLYSPFWTLYNRDFKNFGYSLIHLTDDIDAGDVYAQGRISNVDVRRDNHVLIEHKIILGSFPGIASFLRELEAGTARPIERPTATPGYYSYPGLTDYIRQRWKVMNAKEPPNVPLGDRALHGSDRIQ